MVPGMEAGRVQRGAACGRSLLLVRSLLIPLLFPTLLSGLLLQEARRGTHRRSTRGSSRSRGDNILTEMRDGDTALAEKLDDWCSKTSSAHVDLLAQLRTKSEEATQGMVWYERELMEKQMEFNQAMAQFGADPIAQLEYTMSHEFQESKMNLVKLKAVHERAKAAYHDWDILLRGTEGVDKAQNATCGDQKNYTEVFLTKLANLTADNAISFFTALPEGGNKKAPSSSSSPVPQKKEEDTPKNDGLLQTRWKRITTNSSSSGGSPHHEEALRKGNNAAVTALKNQRDHVEAMAKVCREAGEANEAQRKAMAEKREAEVAAHEERKEVADTSSAELSTIESLLSGELTAFDAIFSEELTAYARMSEEAASADKSAAELLDERHLKYQEWEKTLHGAYGSCLDGIKFAKELLVRRGMYHDEQKAVVKMRITNALSPEESPSIPEGCPTPEASMEALKKIDAMLKKYEDAMPAAVAEAQKLPPPGPKETRLQKMVKKGQQGVNNAKNKLRNAFR